MEAEWEVLTVSEEAAFLLTQQQLLGFHLATEESFVFLEFASSLPVPVSLQLQGAWLASG